MRLITALLILPLLLVGCAAPAATGPASAPSSPAVADPSASPAPDSVVQTERIVLRGDGVDVVSTEGDILESVAFLDDREAILATLERALGAAPEVSQYDGGADEGQPGTTYDWGGIAVSLSEEPYADDFLGLKVRVWEPSVAGVRFVTESGATIGSAFAELEATTVWKDDPSDFAVDIDSVPIGAFEDGSPKIWSVWVVGDESGVTEFFTPSPNYGF